MELPSRSEQGNINDLLDDEIRPLYITAALAFSSRNTSVIAPAELMDEVRIPSLQSFVTVVASERPGLPGSFLGCMLPRTDCCPESKRASLSGSSRGPTAAENGLMRVVGC
jgi:hypothetical protein